MKFIASNLVMSSFVVAVLALTSTMATADAKSPQRSTEAETVVHQISEEASGLLSGIGRLVEERVGWLRPKTVKEMALLWVGVAAALPWSVLSWFKPLLERGHVGARWFVVAVVCGLAVYSGWRIWGQELGTERFASTLVVALPLLTIYFNSIVAGMKVESLTEQS